MATGTETEQPPKKLVKEWVDQQQFYKVDHLLLASSIPEANQARARAFDFSDEDVLIASYPRSGMTWTQEMTWLICNNADTEGARKRDLDRRVPYLEYTEPHIKVPNVEILEEARSSQIIVKTHYPPQYFNKYGKGNFKILLLMRNPKDVVVSYFHICRNLFGFKGSWDDFFDLFMKGMIYYGSWLTHVLKCWELRDDPNVLVVKYEDTQKDHVGTIKKIAAHLGKILTEEQIHTIADYTKIGTMKKNYLQSDMVKEDTSFKQFIRRGIVGEWSEWFTSEQLERVNGLLKEAEMAGLLFNDSI